MTVSTQVDTGGFEPPRRGDRSAKFWASARWLVLAFAVGAGGATGVTYLIAEHYYGDGHAMLARRIDSLAVVTRDMRQGLDWVVLLRCREVSADVADVPNSPCAGALERAERRAAERRRHQDASP